MACANQNFSFENRFQVVFGNREEEFIGLEKNIVAITVPSITVGMVEQPTDIRRIFIPGDSVEFGEITMDFLLDENYRNYKTLFNWLNRLRNFDDEVLQRYIMNISIIILNAQYKTALEMNFEDCFIYDLSAIDLNQQIEDIDPVKFTATFKINGFNIS